MAKPRLVGDVNFKHLIFDLQLRLVVHGIASAIFCLSIAQPDRRQLLLVRTAELLVLTPLELCPLGEVLPDLPDEVLAVLRRGPSSCGAIRFALDGPFPLV